MPSVSSTKETAKKRTQSVMTVLRWSLWALLFVFISVGSLFAYHRAEQFLIREPRFALAGVDDDTGSTIEVRGAKHALRSSIEAVFAPDLGRSIYLVPLDDRREVMHSVPWVKDAAIARIWPNRLVVYVTERVPVAFVTLDTTTFALIDEEGVILPLVKDEFTVPVLAGVRVTSSLEERRERVRRMLRLEKELGGKAQHISEVNVNNPDNFRITQPFEDHMVTLYLGDTNFGARYQNFLNHYSEIKSRLPNAGTLDLRLEDRITAVD